MGWIGSVRRRAAAPAAVAMLLSYPAAAPGQSNLGFEAPEGFEVTLYAGDELAHNIHSMTIDAKGRVVVAGPDYVKVLHDDDGDGAADRATLFSQVPRSGAHGMYFDGADLICSGDDALMRLRDADGDGRADGEPQRWAELRHPEHGTNGIVKGPDGWFYVSCGNDAGVSAEHVTTDRSPIRRPHMGAMVRFSPDGGRSEVLAHGFRNPYDLAFNALGHLFTYDADGERDQYLPWYSPTRFFDVAQGRRHGWVIEGWQRAWNRPEYFFDNVDRLAEPGRGSPTGVVVYRHRRFPQRYRGGLLAACWTFGRVYFVPLRPAGASYEPDRLEVFLQTSGDIGFAPVDLAVGPGGDLFVAIGGRGTRGSVFRVRYTGGPAPPPIGGDDLHRVLAAGQPLSSWSRARWVPIARRLGPEAFEAAVLDEDLPSDQRVRAVEVLVELFDGVSVETAQRVVGRAAGPGATGFVASRTAWALGRKPKGREGRRVLAKLTHHEHPHVQRAAWEALQTFATEDLEAQGLRWAAAADGGEPRVRFAAIQAAARLPPEVVAGGLPGGVDGTAEGGRLDALTLGWIETFRGRPNAARAVDAFERSADPQARLEAVRQMQIALGDIRTHDVELEIDTGYTANEPQRVDEATRRKIIETVAAAFPSGHGPLDHEIARLLGMLHARHPGLLEKLAAKFTADSSPMDDAHYLLVMAQLPGERPAEVTRKTAGAFAALRGKLERRRWLPSRNWPLRIGEAFDRIAGYDKKLPVALVADERFGRAEHAVFARRLSGELKAAAARKMLRRAEAAAGDPPDASGSGWTPELVEALEPLPAEELLPALRRRWDDHRLRDRIARVLAEHAEPADRGRLVEALGSIDPEVVGAAAEALARMEGSVEMADVLAAIRAMSRHEDDDATVAALHDLLRRWTGQDAAARATGESAGNGRRPPQAWREWFSAKHPDRAAELAGFAAADAAQWKRRLAGVDWPAGDAQRGRAIFEQRACAACHEGGWYRVGPELRGVTGRYSREDLFLHIVDPNAAISPLYQAVEIVTRDGRTYVGQPIYESPDSTILSVGMGATVRLTGDEVARRQPATTSSMPAGLLSGLSDRQLADLYAYLRTLR